METLGAARLAKEIPAQRAVAAIVPREEIAAVLKDPETSPELFLRITGEGLEDSGGPSVIAMTWSRDELTRVLDEADGESVVLTFDRDQLSQALGDFEAHGLRERALVFAVAATSALGTGATIADAMPTADVGGAAVTSIAAPAVSTPSSLTDVASAGGYAAVAETASGGVDSMVSDAASAAGYSTPATETDGSATGATVTDASSAGGYTAPATDTTGSASGAMLTDASSSGGYGTVESTGSSGEFLGVAQSDVTDGLLAGGILLAIAGATFAARQTRTPRPA